MRFTKLFSFRPFRAVRLFFPLFVLLSRSVIFALKQVPLLTLSLAARLLSVLGSADSLGAVPLHLNGAPAAKNVTLNGTDTGLAVLPGKPQQLTSLDQVSQGLEGQSDGFDEKQTIVSSKPAVKAEVQRLSHQWDAIVQEWAS